MERKWRLAAKITKSFAKQFPEINPIILQLLKNRGLEDQKSIDEFLSPDYSRDQHDAALFQDLEKALARIDQALKKQENIVIHGDYDADGVCSTCVLKTTLAAIGFKHLAIYIPHRETEGYGLNKNTIKQFIKDKINLIITVDCGVANADEVQLAKENNIDTIITDHHYQPLVMPEAAVAIIDPAIESEPYPFKRLAGVGVAFKLCQALIKKYSLGPGFEKWLLDLVALSTITDCMPLLGENRTLVKYGLIVLNKTRRPGLKKLIKSIGNNFTEIDSEVVGYRIGPRLNAAGRMDHANTAYKLLETDNAAEADELVKKLNSNNTARQKITEKICAEIREEFKKQKDQLAYLALHKDCPIGVLGLVAGKLADEFNRPVLVMTKSKDEIVGSGRSIEELNLIKTIQSCSELLLRYGGHSQACGFTMKKENLDKFKKTFLQFVEKELVGKDLRISLDIEAEIKLSDVNWDLMNALEQFKPFGEENCKPRFLLSNVEIVDWQLVGSDSKHLRLVLTQEKCACQKAIGFGLGEWSQKIDIGKCLDMIIEIDINEWNGNRELQLKIIDLSLCKK